MFTGIVETIGRVREIEIHEATRRLHIHAPAIGPELRTGDSVAVDGACLTVTEAHGDGFAVDVIGTTLERTIAATYGKGSLLNLERALELGTRIDGHIVQGHVDGIGHLIQSEKHGEYWLMDFRLPADVFALTIPRGSVALNGVSLTVAALLDGEACRIGVIPFTWEHTNLGALGAGAPVNVEGDLIGKYVGRALAHRTDET